MSRQLAKSKKSLNWRMISGKFWDNIHVHLRSSAVYKPNSIYAFKLYFIIEEAQNPPATEPAEGQIEGETNGRDQEEEKVHRHKSGLLQMIGTRAAAGFARVSAFTKDKKKAIGKQLKKLKKKKSKPDQEAKTRTTGEQEQSLEQEGGDRSGATGQSESIGHKEGKHEETVIGGAAESTPPGQDTAGKLGLYLSSDTTTSSATVEQSPGSPTSTSTSVDSGSGPGQKVEVVHPKSGAQSETGSGSAVEVIHPSSRAAEPFPPEDSARSSATASRKEPKLPDRFVAKYLGNRPCSAREGAYCAHVPVLELVDRAAQLNKQGAAGTVATSPFWKEVFFF